MGGTASIRIVPIHSKTTIQRTELHNERKEGDLTGKHIDKNKIIHNKTLIGSANDDFYRKVVEKITEQEFTDDGWNISESAFNKENLRFANGRKVRSDAILAAEAIAHYPGQMNITEMGNRYPANPDEFQKWQDNTIEFLQNKFGKENVINAVLHMDESSPHIHAVVVPMCKNKNNENTLKFCHYVDGKKGCAQLQTEYAKAVGYERGVSQQNVNYQSIKQARAILTQSVGAELPPVEKRESAKEYRERVNPEYEKVRVQRDVATADVKKYKNVQKQAAKKDQIIESQKQQIDDLNKRLKIAEAEALKYKEKKEMEKLGMMISDNTQEENELYYRLQRNYITLGEKYVMEHSKTQDIIDKDNDGVDDRITGFRDEDHDGIDDRYEEPEDIGN